MQRDPGLSFQPLVPEFWNGEGRGYIIQYKSSGETSFDKTTRITNENANSHTYTNLEEWTEYNVRVAAFNQVGTSAYSSVASDRTIESGTGTIGSRLTHEYNSPLSAGCVLIRMAASCLRSRFLQHNSRNHIEGILVILRVSLTAFYSS